MSYRETPFFSRIVPRGLSVAEVPYTALHNAAHLHSDHEPLGRRREEEGKVFYVAFNSLDHIATR